MHGKVLILGGNGRFGRHAAEAFWNRGWRVTLFDRERDDLMTVAQGQDVIVNGWNPPYDQWAAQVPALTRQVIHAAQAAGATVIIPGNVYVFGADAPQRLDAGTPHRATNPLGRIRIEMEAAYRASGVRTILLRAGDFIDTEPSGNWFDKVIAAGIDKGRISYPGDPDVPHAWAYLPDLAAAAVALAERRAELPLFSDIPFEGYTLTGHDISRAFSRILGREIGLSRMSWLPLHLARPVWAMAARLLEMRYLWSMPHHLDATAFETLVPEFRATPVDEALARALSLEIGPDEAMTRFAAAFAA